MVPLFPSSHLGPFFWSCICVFFSFCLCRFLLYRFFLSRLLRCRLFCGSLLCCRLGRGFLYWSICVLNPLSWAFSFAFLLCGLLGFCFLGRGLSSSFCRGRSLFCSLCCRFGLVNLYCQFRVHYPVPLFFLDRLVHTLDSLLVKNLVHKLILCKGFYFFYIQIFSNNIKFFQTFIAQFHYIVHIFIGYEYTGFCFENTQDRSPWASQR